MAALDGADSGVPEKFDLGLGKGPFLQHLGGTQLVAAMDDRDFAGKPGQMQRLLNGSVAAAHPISMVSMEIFGFVNNDFIPALCIKKSRQLQLL